MSIQEITAALSQKVSSAQPFGKKIKFSLDGQTIHLDGTTTPPTVTNDDSPADVTISASVEDFKKLMDKSLNPQMAFMSGKIKLQGDMMAAMALQKIF
jgi:putative sterol carrier protein